MKNNLKRFVLALVAIALLTACGAAVSAGSVSVTPMASASSPALQLIQTIPLPNVEGRIDHLAIDLQAQRLFIAALGNNSVEVVDLHARRVVHSIPGLSEPQGIVYLPSLNRLYVANGGTGLVQIFDCTSFVVVGRVQLSGDADNVRYDYASQSVVVGYGDGGMAFIQTGSGKVVKDITLAGHPEAFQLESSGQQAFVNIPTADQIAVVGVSEKRVTAIWLMTQALANYPMALDEVDHRLFVGFRLPARLGVLDSHTGSWITGLDSPGDPDDVFYDAAHHRVFVIGGGGTIDMYSQRDADHYQLLAQVPTASGVRTGLWVPEQSRLYVAVPHDGAQRAEIRVYGLQP